MMNGRWSLLAALVIVLLAAQAGAQRDIFIPGSKGEGSLDTDPVAKAGTVDRVFLMSGDRLSGRVSGISADGILTITNRSFKEPLQIRLKGVNRLTLADKGKILDGPDSVILTNGNRLRGAVEQITLDSIAVNTKAMGMVKIRRSVVAGIEFNIAGSIALDTDFTGGTAEPWQVRSGTWQVQNNRYYCMSSGGWAFVKTKQEGPMTFEWNITGTLNGYVTLSFFAKNAASYWGTDAVAIRLNRNYLYVYRVQNGSTRSVASKSFGVSGTSTKIRASYDPESGRLRLWVNNTDLGQYSINPPIKTGQYIHIYAQTPVAFDSIRVLRGAEGLGKSDKAHETDDQLVLANKDKVSGILVSLSAGV
ncbi:MAG: hypothetical protein QGD94_04565, partial [Planctomycetia bacterium]|nr:hypothetical protein [Planctomycetia bacterium]